MEKFIRVQFYPRHLVREGSVAAEALKAYFTFIRLDAFLQIDDLEPLKVWTKIYNNEHVKVREDQTIIQMSHCYLSRTVGLGLNGVETDIYLTEESYKELMLALGLAHVRIEPKEFHIG